MMIRETSSQNIGLLTVQPPDAAASPKKFYWIQVPWWFENIYLQNY